MSVPHRVTKVLAHVLDACVECGERYPRMGLANVLPDGRIDLDGTPAGDEPGKCPKCLKRQLRSERAEYRKQQSRRAWAAAQARRLPGYKPRPGGPAA